MRRAIGKVLLTLRILILGLAPGARLTGTIGFAIYFCVNRIRVSVIPGIASLAMLSIALQLEVRAVPGTLDPTFGQGGYVFTSIAAAGEPAYLFYPNTESMVVQPDGKILVCGRFWEDSISYWYGTMIVRYMPDGTLDTSFGANGKVAVVGPNFPYGNRAVGADMVLQPDGKILLIGQYTIAGGILVQRYTSSGALDTAFGDNGTTVVVGIAFEEGTAITLQPDGKIVGVGWEYDPTNFPNSYYDAILVFRLNTNGSLDNSFGSAGTGILTIDNGYDGAEVLVQPDGKILVVGTLLNFLDVPATLLLIRYNSNGSPDSNFGTGGRVVQRINQQDTSPSSAALAPDGKIVVLGTTYAGGYDAFIARYNSNGSPDTGFGTNGIFTFESSFFNSPNTVLLNNAGRIVATGNAQDGASGYNGFAVVCLISNGSLDPSFGVGGRSVFPINAGGVNYAFASNGAIQRDGKILVTGYFGYYYTDSHDKIALIRVEGSRGLTRFDYDGDGRSDISVFRPSDSVWYLDRSTEGFGAVHFGLSTDDISPADFDGDGKADIAVFRNGTWWRMNSSDHVVSAAQFGRAGDLPVPSDYTGDGRDDLAVYRSGQWWAYDLSNDQLSLANFGLATDKPVPADYDGDGRVDQAVYRNGEWHLNRSAQGYGVVNFGLAADRPVVGDYDGDGKSDPAVYRDGTWYVLGSSLGFTAFGWGLATDIPVAADYDGDGKTDAAVYRDGTWWVLKSTGGVTIQSFGLANDRPVPSAYLP